MITTRTPDKLHRIALLGLGRSGIAAAQLALACGVKITAFDDSGTCPEAIPSSCWQHPSIWEFDTLDAVILSPGIPHSYPEPHAVAAAAQKANLPILSDIELTYRLQAPSKWVLITGTNGKSTTTSLVGHILTEAGIRNVAGGNLGPALSGLESPGPTGVRVVEISSYQLERTPSLKADISVILNITPDHLDRHGGMDGYVQAKEQALRAVKPDGLKLIGKGDKLTEIASRHKDAQQISTDIVPAAARNNPALQGDHNLENIAAAMAICSALGVSETKIIAAIQTFPGLPHRLQPCGSLGQVDFINDSKATNGEAASKALSAFTNIYWLAGGIGKEDGLSACLEHKQNITAGYFYGRDALAFSAEAHGHITNQSFADMEAALQAAMRDALSQETASTILLSPAAASFDQFTSFEARGDSFMSLVSDMITSYEREVSYAG